MLITYHPDIPLSQYPPGYPFLLLKLLLLLLGFYFRVILHYSV